MINTRAPDGANNNNNDNPRHWRPENNNVNITMITITIIMIIQGIGDHDQLLLLSCEVFGQAVALHLVENKVDNVLYIYMCQYGI